MATPAPPNMEKGHLACPFSYFMSLGLNPLAQTRTPRTPPNSKICSFLSKKLKARIGDKTLTRRFRVGSLARRGRFPSLLLYWQCALRTSFFCFLEPWTHAARVHSSIKQTTPTSESTLPSQSTTKREYGDKALTCRFPVESLAWRGRFPSAPPF